jgi:transketolase
VVGVERFGASAPGGEALERLGITADRVVGAAVDVVDRARPSPRLVV